MTMDTPHEDRLRKKTPAADGQGGGREERSRGALVWRVVVGVVSYALVLTITTDHLFLLAIPGLFGQLAVCFVAAQSVMVRSSKAARPPYATDGTDRRGAVTYHYSFLWKRYAALTALSLVLVVVAFVARLWILYPLAELGMLLFAMSTITLRFHLLWVRCCSRVLKEYDFVFRAPVQELSLQKQGKRQLRVGGESSDLPRMTAREPLGGDRWPRGIAEGVWFAGDDPFGGVLLVPGTGELMCMQPQDWGALAGERSFASAERRERAARAGLDKPRM